MLLFQDSPVVVVVVYCIRSPFLEKDLMIMALNQFTLLFTILYGHCLRYDLYAAVEYRFQYVH